MNEVSVEDEIEQIEMGGRHVVVLGAGASRAAFPSGEANGFALPLMADFVDIVPVQDLLAAAGVDCASRDFEEIYAELDAREDLSRWRHDLESAVFEYFASLRLPDEPTLYDHLVLSLRKKDVIATFNWDPFLIQAIRRNSIIRECHPYVAFLHGNVLAGYCQTDGVHGVRGACSCGKPFEPSRLLHPVADKSYAEDPSISDDWRVVQESLRSAFMVTIFGYAAPKADAAAMRLLDEAWGAAQERSMEQFEIIDVRPEKELLPTWKRFIHTHHYEVHQSPYDSWLFNHPRRSGEAYINQYINARFIEAHPLPIEADFSELWEWFAPLIERERRLTAASS